SSHNNNKFVHQGIQGVMLEGLKEVKDTMLREDPYYVFDMYDQDKDEKLDINEFSNLLVGCSKILVDLDLRKQTIRTILKQFPKFKITKTEFFKMFGLEHVPKRV